MSEIEDVKDFTLQKVLHKDEGGVFLYLNVNATTSRVQFFNTEVLVKKTIAIMNNNLTKETYRDSIDFFQKENPLKKLICEIASQQAYSYGIGNDTTCEKVIKVKKHIVKTQYQRYTMNEII